MPIKNYCFVFVFSFVNICFRFIKDLGISVLDIGQSNFIDAVKREVDSKGGFSISYNLI